MKVSVTLTLGYVIEIEESELERLELAVFDNDTGGWQERLDDNPTYYEGTVGVM